jgi:tRNA (guanine-N7-)-methyltransferase
MERKTQKNKKVIQGGKKFPELPIPSKDPNVNPILKKKKKKKNKNKANNRFDKIVENAKIRKNVKYYNSIINECAKRRNLHSAIQLFDQLKSQSLSPNLFTYSAILNACVRNGAMKKAQEYFDEMKSNKIQLNEVIYTIMIKGYANSDLAKAVKLVEEMEGFSIVPNRRTFNTILRACVRTGNLNSAKKTFKKMKKLGLKRDPIAQAILCKLYAQELKLDRALSYFNSLLKQYPDQNYEDRSGEKPIDKKKNNQKDDEEEDPTANYKIEPMLYILLASVCAINKRKKDAERILEQLKTRMPDDKMSVENIRDKEQILQYLKSSVGKEEKMEIDGELDTGKVTAFRNDPRVFIVEEGNEGNLAPRLKKELKNIAAKSKLAVEIGSGAGHWMAKKASEDSSYHWVAIEKRFERSFEIWLKRKLAVPSLENNITVICGDVHRVLDALPNNAIDKAFINFPDPPASYDDVEKTSFVNTTLMKKIQKALISKGKFVVLTDDRVLHEEFKTMIEALAGEKLVEELKDAVDHVDADTQSFFDNLWKRKGRNERFAIGFTKVKNE